MKIHKLQQLFRKIKSFKIIPIIQECSFNHQSNHIQPTSPNTTVQANPRKLKCGVIPNAPLKLPLLVLPNSSLASNPVCPFEVASTEGSTVAVPAVLVSTVVEKVCEGPP